MGIPSFFPGRKSLSLKMMNKENSEMKSDLYDPCGTAH